MRRFAAILASSNQAIVSYPLRETLRLPSPQGRAAPVGPGGPHQSDIEVADRTGLSKGRSEPAFSPFVLSDDASPIETLDSPPPAGVSERHSKDERSISTVVDHFRPWFESLTTSGENEP